MATGLPRADRELSATEASRFNGCIFCDCVQARFATSHCGRGDGIQRFLDGGVGDAEIADVIHGTAFFN